MEKLVQEIWTDVHLELKKFITGKVNDEDTANDILQDVFLKIHTNIHQVKDTSRLTAWLYQVTRNVIADHYRNAKPQVQIDGLELPEDEAEEPLYLSLGNCINSKINTLPEKYKAAILFTSFNNYSQLALAETLGISYSGAKTRVQRSKDKLKDLIMDCKNVTTDGNGNIVDYTGNKA